MKESKMTQDEWWMAKYNEVKTFIEENHRNPSKHVPEERFKYCNWLKHNKKLLNSSGLKQGRVEKFNELLAMMEENRRVNQYL